MTPDPNEPGQPIAILKELEHDTSLRFVRRVRSRIHRRTAASQLTTYSWHTPKTTLFEMVRLVAHLFQSFGTQKEP